MLLLQNLFSLEVFRFVFLWTQISPLRLNQNRVFPLYAPPLFWCCCCCVLNEFIPPKPVAWEDKNPFDGDEAAPPPPNWKGLLLVVLLRPKNPMLSDEEGPPISIKELLLLIALLLFPAMLWKGLAALPVGFVLAAPRSPNPNPWYLSIIYILAPWLDEVASWQIHKDH